MLQVSCKIVYILGLRRQEVHQARVDREDHRSLGRQALGRRDPDGEAQRVRQVYRNGRTSLGSRQIRSSRLRYQQASGLSNFKLRLHTDRKVLIAIGVHLLQDMSQ